MDTKKENKSDTVRFNCNLPSDLSDRVDDYAKRMNVNKTSAVCILLNRALETDEMVNNLPKLIDLVNSLQTPKNS